MNYDDLEEVQLMVNESVEYQSDSSKFNREDYWQSADKTGDCEDYALRKLDMLIERGWPIEALRLATCWVETGGYHAVLWVDSDKGPRVLDNRHPHIFEPDMVNYKWDRIQSIGGSKTWVKFV